jgi:hypothetical protein
MKELFAAMAVLLVLAMAGEMSYQDEVAAQKQNCIHWPAAFDYCRGQQVGSNGK